MAPEHDDLHEHRISTLEHEMKSVKHAIWGEGENWGIAQWMRFFKQLHIFWPWTTLTALLSFLMGIAVTYFKLK